MQGKSAPGAPYVITHTPQGSSGTPLTLLQLWQTRELLLFLVWTRLRSRYTQSILGMLWVLVRPVVSMVVMTLFFGYLAGLNSDDAPYALFNFVALVPWFYFSSAVSGGCTGLSSFAYLFKQAPLPRILALLVPILERLFDLGASLLVLLLLLLAWGFVPGIEILLLPFFILLMLLASLGVSLCLAPFAVQYRDIGHAVGIGVQVLMYATPVIFSVSIVPEPYRLWYALYPMVGVIEGFRSVLLGTVPIPWDLLLVGSTSTLLLLLPGSALFRRGAHRFDDVV